MDDLKQLMRQHFLQYASYVVLDRAIPNIVDGLKPVQRRILHTLWQMNDGKLHKVANAVGQTMRLHPHGDAAISEALIALANKGYLLDIQGNFGNLFTGDPAAAARYIETRLSGLAKETIFNPQLTETAPSYDGREQEPIVLPAKIPLALMQGATGIAVGMATTILPHNFCELLEAEIALLEGKEIQVIPDFPTGGIIDASEYADGKGKVKVRARLSVKDSKTVVISEICHGTTTESLVRSIDEAAKRGKIKIDGINDYTAEKVEIEVSLPRGQYAEELIPALYAYTDCEVSLNSQIVLIKDRVPSELTVTEILHFYTDKLRGYLKRELELERDRLLQKVFEKTLEQIFIENRLYLNLEKVKSYDALHSTVEKSLVPYYSQLSRIPEQEDREKLLAIPIRRISRFDLDKNLDDIKSLEKELKRVERHLKNVKQFTIRYLKGLLEKYGSLYPRKTEIQQIEELDIKAIQTKKLSVGYNEATGFVGSKVSAERSFECTNFDRLLLLFDDGSFSVKPIPEKEYVHQEGRKLVHVGVADKQTVFRVVYRDPKTHFSYAKRFVVKQYILDKKYRFFDPGMDLQYLTTDSEQTVELQFIPKVRQKRTKMTFSLDSVLVKGVAAKGVRIASRGVKRVKHVRSA